MKNNTKKTIGFFLSHAKQYKLIGATMLISIVLGVVLDMVLPFLYKEFFNTLVADATKDILVKSLILIVIYILAIDLIGWIFWRTAEFINSYFQPRIIANIFNECFEYLHGHSYSFFNDNFTGALVKKIGRIARAFEDIADRAYWDMLPLILRIIIVTGVLFYIHTILGATILIWVVVFAVVNYFLSIYKLKFDLKRSEADTKITANLADTIANSINIKLFSNFAFESREFGDATDSWFKKTKKTWNVENIINAAQALFMITLNFLILYFAVRLWQKNLLTVGDFVLIQTYLIDVFANLWNFGRIIRSIYSNLADAEEMTIVLNTPHEIKDRPYAKELEIKEGRIEFRNVKFSYDENKETINDLSFIAKPAEKIALIGPSGGGKTTLIKLLLRLYNIKRGQILIDDQDIFGVTQDSLRKSIALVPQDPILFHRTIMENIRYGRLDAKDEEVIEAAKLSRCHDFIMKLRNGYGSFVGERGIKLSGGERQRVAIARAILSNAKILILDEATSQLDSQSEMLIKEALKNLMKNKTAIVVAHRLSTVMQMDRAIVVQDGRIVEEGDHKSLINKEGSLYKKLWDLQAHGFFKDEEDVAERKEENTQQANIFALLDQG
ncbi:ABC transporter ATP-binding protein [Candidatus Peregrinibacteria bacterium]|nr:ABC transporter ATP-binding protein [Candidatus Peregrinibacteria bacterium]